MTKKSLRQKLLNKRRSLMPNDVRNKSGVIVERVKQIIDWGSVSALHCFTSIAEMNEPDTIAIFAYLEDNYPQIKVFTSRKVESSWQHGLLEAGEFKIISELPKLDVVLVPCLGFDTNNNRLGYGGGYYDKFLASHLSAQKIGLAFELSKVDKIPVEAHDVRLDRIVTEKTNQ
ncbi:MAG: 5-formyltetrahydrofolate cyclo-ligase [Candidatus Saccharibacteria bacterium]|nr:5-formyltetrahydrofolate cyclo-ligase [Candidatus Saccharibacteria bacterium]